MITVSSFNEDIAHHFIGLIYTIDQNYVKFSNSLRERDIASSVDFNARYYFSLQNQHLCTVAKEC